MNDFAPSNYPSTGLMQITSKYSLSQAPVMHCTSIYIYIYLQLQVIVLILEAERDLIAILFSSITILVYAHENINWLNSKEQGEMACLEQLKYTHFFVKFNPLFIQSLHKRQIFYVISVQPTGSQADTCTGYIIPDL